MTHSRRKFLGRSVRGGLLAGAMPLFFSEWLAGCSPARSMVSARKDEWAELRAALADKAHPIKWLFTGDSITQGAKHTLGLRSFPEIFSEHIRYEMARSRDLVLNSAISGHTTRELLSDFDWRIAEFRPRVILLMIGTNDAAAVRGITPTEFAGNLSTLVDKMRALGAIPILQTPNTIDMAGGAPANDRKELSAYVEQLRSVSADKKVIMIDHWKVWEDKRIQVASEHWRNDPLHPNGMGHLHIARTIFDGLNIADDKSFTCVGKLPC